MKIALLILKTAISLGISVPAIILICRDWKHYDRRTNLYKLITKIVIVILVIASVLSAAVLWLDPLAQSSIAKRELELARPEVSISVSDPERGRIDITVSSRKTTGNTVDSLSFQLDIPGIFQDSVEKPSERAGQHRVFSSFLAGSNGRVIAETVLVNCYSISPGGHSSFSLLYQPTEPEVREAGSFREVFHPLMDLHDVSRYYFHWNYKGIGQTETGYLDFSQLSYIQEDNNNLQKTIPSLYPDDKSVKKMEEKRRDWYQ